MSQTGILGYLIAFGGGIVSFLSPCVLPLVPAYLSVVTALDLGNRDVVHTAGECRVAGGTATVLKNTGLFIAGFGSVFVILGLSASAAGSALGRYHVILTRASGIVVVCMAAFLLGSAFVRSPWINLEKRFQIDLSRIGALAAPVAGAAFAFGWTPCLGPVLASVLAVAADQQREVAGATLLLAYSAGLGIPFLLTGLAYDRAMLVTSRLKRYTPAITVAAGIFLAAFGVLLALNRFSLAVIGFEDLLRAVGLGSFIQLG